ncbi:MAG: hypothetical protein QM537_04705, partial [Candidatus Symbiobacter sp.]|nr:hypothetical protein [Candidatus Symbiobacter sp.]
AGRGGQRFFRLIQTFLRDSPNKSQKQKKWHLRAGVYAREAIQKNLEIARFFWISDAALPLAAARTKGRHKKRASLPAAQPKSGKKGSVITRRNIRGTRIFRVG